MYQDAFQKQNVDHGTIIFVVVMMTTQVVRKLVSKWLRCKHCYTCLDLAL